MKAENLNLRIKKQFWANEMTRMEVIVAGKREQQRMVDACYTAQATAKEHALHRIARLKLTKNAAGQYTHDAIMTYVMGIRRVSRSTYNPWDPGGEIEKRLVSSTSATPQLVKIKSTDTATVERLFTKLKAEAAAMSDEKASTPIIVQPRISTRNNAQDEAGRINQIIQADISVKEGGVDTIMQQVGTNVTDSVLRTADDTDTNVIGEYEFAKVIAAVL